MKKRKPPIILATLLIILVGTGVALNVPSLKKKAGEEGQPPEQQQQQQAPPPAAGAPRAAETKDEIAKRMRGTMGPATRTVANGDSSDQPSIKVTKQVPYVQPNDPNRTSQQWYKKGD